MTNFFENVETTKDHNGYFCSVGEVLTIVILGSFCGLENVSQIHQWASNARVLDFLARNFDIQKIPCYYWLLCLLKIIKIDSLNQCFTNWVQSLLPKGVDGLTLSLDGKTIRSTEKMDKYSSPLHIISAQIAELGITFGQQTVGGKTNEIPAVRELLSILQLDGCIVVADALNCQKQTAKAIVDGKADYLLNVKDNQETLKKDIADYVQDDSLRETMDTASTQENNRGRIELRTAFSTSDIEWLFGKEKWEGLASIGAVNRIVTSKTGTTNEWHYFISSRELSAEELLRHVRLEWSVETMHWLLDVHFREDYCRVEDENIQQSLNIIRKIALNCIKTFKKKTGSKRAISKIMFGCFLEPDELLPILTMNEN